MLGRNLFLLLAAMSAQVACQASSDGQREPQEDGAGGNMEPSNVDEPEEDGEAEPREDAATPNEDQTPAVVDAGKPGSGSADASMPADPPRTPLDCKDRSLCWQFDDLKAGERLPIQYGAQKLSGASKLEMVTGIFSSFMAPSPDDPATVPWLVMAGSELSRRNCFTSASRCHGPIAR